MNTLVSGAMVMAYLVAGLFFLRFWVRSRDALFAFFAVAFWLLAAQRLALSFTSERHEDSMLFYLLRLFAFVVILAGIWHKNRVRRNGA